MWGMIVVLRIEVVSIIELELVKWGISFLMVVVLLMGVKRMLV